MSILCNPEFENYQGQTYPVKLEIRDTLQQRNTLLLLTWIYSYWLGGTVNFTFPFTTNVMISTSISQIFRFWVAIFHLLPPMASLSRSLYDMPRLAPHMMFYSEDNATFKWASPTGIVQERLKSSLRSFVVDTGILSNNMKFPFHEC